MKCFVLDASALLTLRDNEPGADRVSELLHQDPEFKPLPVSQELLPLKPLIGAA